jgi:hypothetical protein
LINEKQYNAKFTPLETLYTKRFLAVNKAVYNSFIEDLQTHGLTTAKINLSNIFINDKLTVLLESLYKQAGVKGARLTYRDLQQHGLSVKAGGFGKNETWIRNVINYLRLNILDFAAKITSTIREDILKVIEKAVSEGWGIDKIVDQLKSSGLPRARARVIARTETIRAANVGHSEGAKSFPYEVNKKWSSAKDHRVRHSHRLVNNHVTDEEGTFKVPIYKGDKPTGQSDLMLYPGDKEAHPSNTINCRCRVIYEPKRDAQGRLIRRTGTPATIIPLRPSQLEREISIAASARKALIDNIEISVE